jgi:NAD-dependent SIR2 family protein deacetylase
MGDNCLDCAEFRCDHARCGWKPREEPEEEAHDFSSPSHCKACMRAWIGPDAVLGDEPPLTPEEEEEAAPEVAVDDFGQPIRECYACDRVGCSGCVPPQPERRPPYAVAYSVQGHLFEVALPGDATVRAVDGALVIQHHLGPVAGIVSVLPVINKEGTQ